MKLINLVSFLFFFSTLTFAQGITVGLKINEEASFNGYTLFTPIGSNNTWLVDNCGYKVNEWQHSNNPELCAYLLPNGNLLRSTHLGNDDYTQLEIVDWQNNPVWTLDMTPIGRQHHDMELLPNGNILTIIEDPYSDAEAIEAGRDPTSLPFLYDDIWSERIIEIEPIGESDYQIVWEWKAWDHLIQDHDDTKQHYGAVEEHPGKLDVNVIYEGIAFGWINDWLHINGIDYNAERDEILLSSRHISEIFIIDHSTSSAEASTDAGGNSGKGGELLWRWGNPQNYRQGNADDRRLYGQHNPSFIPEDYDYHGGKISVFNNGDFRPEGDFSTVEIIEPAVDNDGVYVTDAEGAYLPEESYYTYEGTVDGNVFFSQIIGGVQVQPNGNILVCDGIAGRFFEVTPPEEGEELVWLYVSPDGNSIAEQGTFVNNAWQFRSERYAVDFEGFMDKDMTPYALVEDQNSNSENCDILEEENPPSAIDETNIPLYAYPNPALSFIHVDLPDSDILLYDIFGKTYAKRIQAGRISVMNLDDGYYFFRLGERQGSFVKM